MQWASADRGACYLGGLASQLVRVTHFGYYDRNSSWGPSPWGQLLQSQGAHPLAVSEQNMHACSGVVGYQTYGLQAGRAA